jgi:hypothetical protein
LIWYPSTMILDVQTILTLHNSTHGRSSVACRSDVPHYVEATACGCVSTGGLPVARSLSRRTDHANDHHCARRHSANP